MDVASVTSPVGFIGASLKLRVVDSHMVSETCEAHVDWLNGPYLRSIIILLRPHIGKHMGSTRVSPETQSEPT